LTPCWQSSRARLKPSPDGRRAKAADPVFLDQRAEAEARAQSQRLAAGAESEIQRIKTQAEIDALRQREAAAAAYKTHPALLRLYELETLRDLARTANARIYIDLDRGRSVERRPDE
jgi:regulator of protease activity HflC (stomatin/prohibitin superfamily)